MSGYRLSGEWEWVLYYIMNNHLCTLAQLSFLCVVCLLRAREIA